MKVETYYGTGRRKTSVARVYLRPGTGKFEIVNGVVNKDARRTLEDYFPIPTLQQLVLSPLELTNLKESFDVYVNLSGGGLTGQAGAVRHGISRALLQYQEDLRPALKEQGFMTRDPRGKERKKYGQPGARKRFQYSKR